MKTLTKPLKFDWDKGNEKKNWEKHKVSQKESEEIFFDKYKLIYKDILHSETEERHVAIGETKTKRVLFIIFTLRKRKIRIISARDMGKAKKSIYYKNRRKYEKAT